jgi:hypothetical protein
MDSFDNSRQLAQVMSFTSFGPRQPIQDPTPATDHLGEHVATGANAIPLGERRLRRGSPGYGMEMPSRAARGEEAGIEYPGEERTIPDPGSHNRRLESPEREKEPSNDNPEEHQDCDAVGGVEPQQPEAVSFPAVLTETELRELYDTLSKGPTA